MDQGPPVEVTRCGTCGRDYTGEPPAFCVTCGAAMERRIKVPTGAQVAPPPPGHSPAAPGFNGQQPVPGGLPYPGYRQPAYQQPAPPAQAAPPAAKKPGSRKVLKALIASLVIVLILAGGVIGAVIVFKPGRKAVPLPATAQELRASVAGAEEYLTEDGKILATGRGEGAPIYSVSAKLDVKEQSVSGDELLLYENKTGVALSEVVLRVYANSPVVTAGGTGATISGVTVDGRQAPATMNGSLLRVSLPAQLAQGGEALLKLSYKETIPLINTGLGGLETLMGQQPTGGYGIFGRTDSIYNLGYFIPTMTEYGAGGWEKQEVPAFGDPGDFGVAYYSVSMDVPEGYVVAATGLVAGESASGGRKRYDFRGGPVRDFTAQVGLNYKVSTATVGETTVSSYYSKDSAEGGGKALTFAQNALKQFNTHFGAYPFKRFNVCEAALAGSVGGMEFSGQVQIAQMLYDLGSIAGDEAGKLMESLGGNLMADMMEFVVAHETCHEWWGLVVGSDPIRHPWQDESLTNYCTVLYFKWQYGQEAADKQMEMQIKLPYSMGGLLSSGDMAVDSPVTAFTDINQYTAIVYSKGAMFFEVLEQNIGSEAFDKSLQQYYKTNAFRVATPADLVTCFEANSSNAANVAALHRRWIMEEHADEDIAATVPGTDMLNDLMKDLLPPGFDTEQLEEMLKQYMESGEMPEIPGFPSVPETAPDMAI